MIDHERRQLFEREGDHYESDYYLTFVYLPSVDSINKVIPLFLENSGQNQIDYRHCLERFISETEALVEIIKSAIPAIEKLNDDETLTYLHSTISTKYHQVKSPEIPMYLDALLPDEPLTPGLEPRPGQSYLRITGLRSFPGQSLPVLFDRLNQLELEYRWVSRYIFLDKASANRELNKYKRTWWAKRKSMEVLIKDVFSRPTDRESIMTDTDAKNKASDSDQALQELNADQVAYGYYTCVVIVHDPDKERADEKIKEGRKCD